jgi:hypothetical protein
VCFMEQFLCFMEQFLCFMEQFLCVSWINFCVFHGAISVCFMEQCVRVSGAASQLVAQTWGWWLLQIGTPLILLIGLPGNLLSLLVLKSRRFRGKSYSHYLSALTVFDSLVLIAKFVRRLDDMMVTTGRVGVFGSYGDAACKLHNFTEHVCFLMSSWLVLCMTIERFVAVVFPFKKDTFCKPRNAVTIIMIVFTVISYSQIFRLIVIEKEHGICTSPKRYLHVYVALHVYMYQLALQFMLPAVLIVVCNLTILYKIRQLRYSVTRHGYTHNYTQYTKHNKTTCMLVMISFTYVVTLLPLVLLSLVIHVSVSTSPATARFILRNLKDLRFVLELISEINYCVNFCIYVMSGAQFRYELRHICSRRRNVSSTGTRANFKVFYFKKSCSS